MEVSIVPCDDFSEVSSALDCSAGGIVVSGGVVHAGDGGV